MSASRYVHIQVDELIRMTDKAMLVRLDDEKGEEIWLPLSQIADPDDYHEGDCDFELAITEWLAREKGLDT